MTSFITGNPKERSRFKEQKNVNLSKTWNVLATARCPKLLVNIENAPLL
jgi:hypothetical protein